MLTIEARSFDDPDVGRLVRMLFDDLNERYEDDEGDEGWWAEVTPAKVAPPDGVFLVALWDGEAVGCGGLKHLDDTTGEIKRMFVESAGRRRGVSRALLARLEDEARALGYDALQLETGGPQHEAVALYESAGWTRIPPYGRYSSDPRSICFRKELGDDDEDQGPEKLPGWLPGLGLGVVATTVIGVVAWSSVGRPDHTTREPLTCRLEAERVVPVEGDEQDDAYDRCLGALP